MASSSSAVERTEADVLAWRPEVRLINDTAVIADTLRKLVTVFAYLSLTWSTVVLLGGFVSNLKLIDFWFLTAISALFAVKSPKYQASESWEDFRQHKNNTMAMARVSVELERAIV
ncbi:hypothetical protein HU200_060939 [Digitaria exilis]|uniref:Uncharacterized protein n=1 Tax=Digitaria exilis TaxID=1010633 RepID=A0A835A5J0_9POAL|nr:hypothetical protein HU200_060939 [Digitaria exilis]CAB3462698.1 unnamed protein product [Digitaria exilis]